MTAERGSDYFVIARSVSDEAIHSSSVLAARWIASLALAMTMERGAASRAL
jgi:hypothetical protein